MVSRKMCVCTYVVVIVRISFFFVCFLSLFCHPSLHFFLLCCLTLSRCDSCPTFWTNSMAFLLGTLLSFSWVIAVIWSVSNLALVSFWAQIKYSFNVSTKVCSHWVMVSCHFSLNFGVSTSAPCGLILILRPSGILRPAVHSYT